jgi:tetratricopeptide (TPR) repeat protein
MSSSEECVASVRGLFSPKILVLSILLGNLPRLYSHQLPATPPSASSAAAEFDCDRKRAEAHTLGAVGNPSGAVTLLTDVYSKCPSYENGRDLADAEVEAGQYESAKALITSLLKEQNRADLHSILGKAETAEKNYKAAAIEYQKAAEMEPSEINIFNFGMSLFRLNHNAAITILRYGTQKYPDSIKLRVALGTVLYADGNSLEGAQLLCEAEELNPSDPHPMELLAETEIVPPQLAPRITSLFADLHKRYEHDGLILYDYTMVQSGRWSNSSDTLPPHFADSLEAALRLNPELSQAYFQLGLLAEQQKNYTEEIRLLKKAIALDPNKELYHYRLALAYRNAGDKANFQEELNEFQKLHGATPDGQ